MHIWSKGYVCLLCCIGVGLDVSAFGVTNTSIGLQWSDDTPGITDFKVCVIEFAHLINSLCLFSILH